MLLGLLIILFCTSLYLPALPRPTDDFSDSKDLLASGKSGSTWTEAMFLVGLDRAGDTVGKEILLCGNWDTEGTIRNDCMS